MFSLCLVIQRGLRVTPLGLALNLENTTSSVLSELLLILALHAYNSIEFSRNIFFFLKNINMASKLVVLA